MFPKEMGGDLGGKTFIEILKNDPKTVEFVDKLWLAQNTTGIFREFHMFVKTMLRNPLVKSEHRERARAFVKTLSETDIPSYMKKYKRARIDPSIIN